MKSITILLIVSIAIVVLVGIHLSQNTIEGLTSGYYCKPTHNKKDHSNKHSSNYTCTSVKDDPSGASKYVTYKTLDECKQKDPNCSKTHHGHSGHSPTKKVDGAGNITFICENTVGSDDSDDEDHKHHKHHKDHKHHGHHPASNSFDSFDIYPTACGHHGF